MLAQSPVVIPIPGASRRRRSGLCQGSRPGAHCRRGVPARREPDGISSLHGRKPPDGRGGSRGWMGPVTRPDTTRTAPPARRLSSTVTRRGRGCRTARRPWSGTPGGGRQPHWSGSHCSSCTSSGVDVPSQIRVTVETIRRSSAQGHASCGGVACRGTDRRTPACRCCASPVGSSSVLALSASLLLTCGNGGVVIGEQTVPSGLAALLVASVPLWVVVLRFPSGDRPRWHLDRRFPGICWLGRPCPAERGRASLRQQSPSGP